MAPDDDVLRTRDEDEPANESVEVIQAQRSATTQTAVVDAEFFDLPGADLSHEELTVAVIPEQSDEFTCGSCFLVRDRSQLAHQAGGVSYRTDCEG